MADVILSERLEIRPFTRGDITDEYIGWLNDQQLMQHSRQRLHVHTAESCEGYLRSFEGTRHWFWNVDRRDNGRQVGTMTAYVNWASTNVGLLIGHPGEGYGSEAFGAVLAYLFEYEEVRKVVVGTQRTNEAMIRIALRWGMRRERGTADIACFGIFRQQWLATCHVPITVAIR